MYKDRLRRLQERMTEEALSAFVVTNPVNRAYLTGFTGTAGTVLVGETETVLFVDFRYTEQAKEQAGSHCSVVEHGADVKPAIRAWLDERKIRSLAFEKDVMTYGTYTAYSRELEGIELIPADGLTERLRVIKDRHELKVLAEAAELADHTYEHILHVIKPGMKERDIALELEFFMRQHGAAATSFETIVASGERSAMPHGTASDRVLQSGDFVTMDFGAYYQGYCSDITRTIVLGKASDKHKEIYQIVLEAQMYTLEHLQPGMTGKEADALARDIITRYGYGDRFGHSTGHGIGMEIHESPRLSKQSDTVLKPGMVVTVEPGIYIPGFGGVRIEDDVCITETGASRLTQSSKELVELQ